MKTGKIKLYSRDRNFGFVVPSITGEPEVYFNGKAIEAGDIPHLRGGRQVFYELAANIQTTCPAARIVRLAGVEI